MSASSEPCSPDTVRSLQEKAARALPAEHVEHVGGWWLRHSTSSAWWAGTVLPHADAGPEELVRRVAGAERFYAVHGTAARFQITPWVCPAALDTVLAQASTDSLLVRLDDDPTSAWFEVWHAVSGHAGDRRAEWDMLRRVKRPSAYASAMLGNDV